MDISSKYKIQAFSAGKIQEMWVPSIGDFWCCSCPSCIESDRVWVLDQADVLAINPDADLDRYYRDLKAAVMTSMDCGFGAYWRHFKQDKQRGFVWLPRFDQSMQLVTQVLKYSEPNGAFKSFIRWFENQRNDELESIEQIALAWAVHIMPD